MVTKSPVAKPMNIASALVIWSMAVGLQKWVPPDYDPPDVLAHAVPRETHPKSARVRAVADHLIGALHGLPVLT